MTKITIKNFKEALKKSGGNQSIIAKRLGVTRGAITSFINRKPKMRELVEIEGERIIDVAENIVDSKITNDQDLDTAKWKLINSKRGKARGYGNKTELEHSGETIGTTFNLITKSVEEIKDAKCGSEQTKSDNKPQARGNINSS